MALEVQLEVGAKHLSVVAQQHHRRRSFVVEQVEQAAQVQKNPLKEQAHLP